MKTSKQNFTNAMNVASALSKDAKDKLASNCEIFIESNEATAKQINRELKKIRIKHCVTDENGGIIMDEKGNFKFSKESILELEDDIENLMQEEVEVIPCITSVSDCERVEKSGLATIKQLSGILIP